MILQRRENGLSIVRQPEHGRQTGLFAEQWGNEDVAPVGDRRESIRLAGAHHDDGWAIWELHPSLDAETGQPVQFHALTPVEHLPLYRAGIERAAAIDAYAGILVSMHGSGLYNGRYGTFRLVELNLNNEERALVEEFLRDMAEMQQSIAVAIGLEPKAHVSEDPEVREAYLRLQVWDRLSLQFLYFGAADGVIAPLPLGDGRTSELVCRNVGPLHISLDPYPFATSKVVFPVTSVVVPDRRYPTPDAFLEAVRDATPVTLECTVSRA